MTTLSASATFTIGAGSTAVESVTLPILPALASGNGRGRLVHPTLGAYDYAHQPDKWTGIDGDLIVAPIWSNTKTLLGAANTLVAGHIRDVLAVEHWTSAVSIAHLRALLLFFANPPDPADGAVEWWPDYTSSLGYQVALVGLESGSEAITLDWISRQYGVVTEGCKLSLRILDRAS